MAVSANAVWRVRPSGNNINGGGFDCSLSSSASGSNGVISGTNTFTDTTAAAFTSGMTGSAINIAGVGQFKFTFVSSTVGTLTIGSSGTLQPIGANGVKFSWTMGAGQDYSQQNTAQATGTLGTASGTTTFTDAGGAFTSAMVGNALWIASGAGFTVGAYFITAFGSSTSVTLDRSPGTGTVAVWAVGGGWADPLTNTNSNSPLVPGNTINLLGSGTPNPASYTFDYTKGLGTPTTGSSSGKITFQNDPGTPGYKAPPDTTGGMPTIPGNGGGSLSFQGSYLNFLGLWTVSNGGSANAGVGMLNSVGGCFAFGCVFDQFGNDVNGVIVGVSDTVVGCEVFSSVAPGAAGSRFGIGAGTGAGNGTIPVIGCNIHDVVGVGVSNNFSGGVSLAIINCIVAKAQSDGINLTSSSFEANNIVMNNTIDGNLGNGIIVVNQQTLVQTPIMNNIISNHTQAGKFGLTISAGTTAQNSSLGEPADYNVFYNNTANYNAISPGPHDTALSSTPYVASSTENYQLA